MADYFSFEEVMGELQVDEDELKRMVSEGELRAFRSENKMKFKKEDVENLKKGRVSEPTVILPSAPTPPQGVPAVDDTALELDLGPDVSEEKRPTEELLPKAKTSAGEEPLVFDDTDVNMEEVAAAKAPDETFAEEEEVAAGVASPETEPLKFADEPAVGEMTEEAVTAAAPAAPARPRAAARRGAAVPSQIPAYVEAQIEKRRAHWIWTVVMCCSLIVTVLYAVVLYDVLRFNTGKIDKPSKITDQTVYYILKNYWGDERWVKFHTYKYPHTPGSDDVLSVVKPPFSEKTHRTYDWISYDEPDKPLSMDELKPIQEQIRIRRGMQEAPKSAEGSN
jgi:hypothetical protein